MTSWVKIIDGIVDTVAFTQPGSFVIVEATEESPETRAFVPDTDFVATEADVFAGYTFNNGVFAPPQGNISTAMVNTERDRREQLGCSVSVPGAGTIPLEGNERSMRNLQGLAFAASLRLGQGDSTTITTFRDAQNVDHALVPAQVVSLWSQGASYISALYAASWAIKAQKPIPANYADNVHWPSYE